jgi:hypothetical protein
LDLEHLVRDVADRGAILVVNKPSCMSRGEYVGYNEACRTGRAEVRWVARSDHDQDSGEAELETIRLTDDRSVNKHYDLTSRHDLNVLLDELIRLLVQHEVPDAAVVLHAPGPSARQGDTAPRVI